MPSQRFKGFTVFKGPNPPNPWRVLRVWRVWSVLRGVARGGCWLQDEACQVNVLRVLRF